MSSSPPPPARLLFGPASSAAPPFAADVADGVVIAITSPTGTATRGLQFLVGRPEETLRRYCASEGWPVREDA